MKKAIGLAVLMLTGLTAFAAPLARNEARAEGFHKTAIVAHKSHGRKGMHRGVKKTAFRARNQRRVR